MATSLSTQPLSSLAPDHALEESTMVCVPPSVVVAKEGQVVPAGVAAAEASQWSDLISIALGLSPQRTGAESPQLSKRDKRTAISFEEFRRRLVEVEELSKAEEIIDNIKKQ